MFELVIVLIFMVMVIVALCLMIMSLRNRVNYLEKIVEANQKEFESTKEFIYKVITDKTYFYNF